ncbi:MAG TPA: EAL domain-containing protein [Terriglobales bacterium]|nr:EAL domain-containing protein [Terriglobales bacterium]
MRPFRDWSIRHKLTGLFLTMACLTAISVGLPLGVFDFLGLRRAMARDLATLADATARNSTAALTFGDVKSAQDVLQALRAEPGVTAACIYGSDGKPFARYVRQGELSNFAPPPAQGPVTRFEPTRLILFRYIALDGETVGTIYLESDLQRLDARLREYTWAFLATVSLSLLLALIIAARLQRPISQPLGNLVSTAGAVSRANDYSIRAELTNRDEFGLLVAAFNGMLEQIEKRDRQLRQHRQELEQEVASRTAELLVANKQLQRAKEKYRAIFEDAVIGIFQIAPDGRPISINRALAQIHGYGSPDRFMAEVHNFVEEFFVHPQQMDDIRRRLEDNVLVRDIELELYRCDGSKRNVLANIRAVRDGDGKLALLEGTIEDITDRKQAEERIQFLAYYDALTGLPNRTLLQDRLDKALASARRRGEKVALLFMDLDRFKIINDSLGHSFGDLLLQEVAERLKKCARDQDTVARIGGDEFVVVMAGIRDAPDSAVAAERIMDAVSADFLIHGRTFNISCSVGIGIFPEHGTDSENLIKNADTAMYCAKESGRNSCRFFTDEMNAQVVERLTIERNLRLALDREEFFLVYQPQVDLCTAEWVGMEALVRWKHPELGLVPPDKFIRVAENSGLILPLGEWVLRTACSTVCQWQRQGLPVVPVAVNVSAVQFRQENFCQQVAAILQETALPPHHLELELTESLLLSSADMTFPLLRQLKGMGVKLAIDDFGTGYSSLSYLRHFPVNKLKIDRSFVKAVAQNADDAAITAAIISMGKSLNLQVIAEGVENEEQISFLRGHQCDQAQGYYYSRPLTAEEVAEQLRNRPTLAASHAAP